MSGPPSANPQWFHRTIAVPIGKVEFLFRTLSLFDVWACWPHLLPIKHAIENGKPLDFHDHLKAVLEILQPALAEDDAAMRLVTQTHIDLLINFYERQDWGRIAALADRTTDVGAAASGTDPEEAHQLFVLMCAAAARHCNMAMTDFIQQRFEFCADQILALRHATEQAQAAVDDGKANTWRDATMKLAATFGVKPEAMPENKKPEWMKALDRVRVVVN